MPHNLIIPAFSPLCGSLGLSRCLSGKESSMSQEDSLEEEMAAHSSNPINRGAWRAIVHRAEKSWTELSTHAGTRGS